MNQWLILLNKEILEMSRNYKLIWVPITFILLGVMDPLTTYYLPEILNSLGDLPEGTKIEMPVPTANEVFIMSLGEYQFIGILVIVLSMMGIVAGERKSGVAQLILVKPVSYTAYITSKWAGVVILFLLSLFVGLLGSWYYTGVLFEFIPFGAFMAVFAPYAFWLVLVMTLVILCSSAVKNPGAAAMISLLAVFLFNIAGGTFSHLLEWSPTQLLPYATEKLMTGNWPDHIWPAAGLTGLLIIVFLVIAIILFKRKELAD